MRHIDIQILVEPDFKFMYFKKNFCKFVGNDIFSFTRVLQKKVSKLQSKIQGATKKNQQNLRSYKVLIIHYLNSRNHGIYKIDLKFRYFTNYFTDANGKINLRKRHILLLSLFRHE